jgi:DNA-directed RNA polymerase specialized sigma24 family protein
MKFNSNNERKAYWETLIKEYSPAQLERAFNSLKVDTAKVIDLRYRQQYSMKEIAIIMNRSITVIRNHHNRGIYKLYRFFNPYSSENI